MFFWTLRKRFFTGFVRNACIGVHGNILKGNKFSWTVLKHEVFYRFLARSVWMVFPELICTCMQRLFGLKQLRLLDHAHQFSGFQRKKFQCFRLALIFFRKGYRLSNFCRFWDEISFFSCCSKGILHSRGNRLFYLKKIDLTLFFILGSQNNWLVFSMLVSRGPQKLLRGVFLKKRLIYWKFPSWQIFLAGVPKDEFYVQWV